MTEGSPLEQSGSSPLQTFSFSDLDQFADLIRHGGVELTKVKPGDGFDRLSVLQLPQVLVRKGEQYSEWTCTGTALPGMYSFVIPWNMHRETRYNGIRMEDGMISLYAPGAVHISNGGRSEYLYVTVPQQLLETELAKLQVARPHFANGCHISRSEPATVSMVTALVHRMMHIATTRGGDLELGLVAMERSLITALVLALDDPDPVLDELMDRRATRQAMFLMTVDFALNHMNKDLYVTDLCGVTGIAERTLRQVFQEFTNMSPIAFLNLVRLRRARQLLLNGDPEQMSVKYAALDSGFWDLGRFSVRYRSLFGESPSRTLASAVASEKA